jgi:hypothetical protein
MGTCTHVLNTSTCINKYLFKTAMQDGNGDVGGNWVVVGGTNDVDKLTISSIYHTLLYLDYFVIYFIVLDLLEWHRKCA